MNKKIIFLYIPLFVILFISLVSAQEKGEGGGPAPVPANGSSGGGGGGRSSISGKILPIDSNATVYAILPVNEIIGFSTINGNGEYSITLPFGIYDLLIVAKGDYINKTVPQIGVNENEITEVQDIILARIGETGSISGYVNPIIEGTIVKIKKFGLTEYAGESVVGNDGKYYFTNLEPDTYGLFVDFNRSQEFYNYRWGMIDIFANVSLSGINLTFSPKTNNYLIDRILVSFQPGVTENEKRDIISSFNSKIMSHYSYSRLYIVAIPPDKTVEEMIGLFKTNSEVKDTYLEGIAYTGGPIVVIKKENTLEEEQQKENINIQEDTPSQVVLQEEEISEPEEVEVLEEKNLLFLWIIIPIVILGIIVFLITKFKKSKVQ